MPTYLYPFQERVYAWVTATFGMFIATNITERTLRFMEEALELAQTTGLTKDEAHKLVDYVYDRPTGVMHQEVGGVMVTLAALCAALYVNMEEEGNRELTRIGRPSIMQKIREKQARKAEQGYAIPRPD